MSAGRSDPEHCTPVVLTYVTGACRAGSLRATYAGWKPEMTACCSYAAHDAYICLWCCERMLNCKAVGCSLFGQLALCVSAHLYMLSCIAIHMVSPFVATRAVM